jgi:hypothetical protein
MRVGADCGQVVKATTFTVAKPTAKRPCYPTPPINFFNLQKPPPLLMKKLFTSALVLALALTATLAASAQTIRRVSATATGTNIYATFALAQTAAANNDIIQMEPGTYSFDINLTKPLVVVGPGYFLDRYSSPALQANTTPATVNTIYFSTGSSGASVSGITAGQCYIGASTVTLQRCQITSTFYVNYPGAALTNINIRQNYLANLQNYSGAGTSNLLITNNIINSTVSLDNSCNGDFSNNTMPYLYTQVTLNNFNVTSNYFGYYAAIPTLTNCTATYNALYFTGALTGTGNINNVQQANVFVQTPAPQFDGWFQLKSGTNALLGAGAGGTNIGSTGGNTPYKAGGVPAIPAIYQLSNSVGGNTLNVNLSTRSNN